MHFIRLINISVTRVVVVLDFRCFEGDLMDDNLKRLTLHFIGLINTSVTRVVVVVVFRYFERGLYG